LIGFSGEIISQYCLERHLVGAIPCWPWIVLQGSLVVSGVWMGVAMTINAFHPAYVETYMPQFISTLRKESGQKANGQKFGALSRAKQPSLENTDFYVYARAGMPKGVKK
jgi:hypothetical protein